MTDKVNDENNMFKRFWDSLPSEDHFKLAVSQHSFETMESCYYEGFGYALQHLMFEVERLDEEMINLQESLPFTRQNFTLEDRAKTKQIKALEKEKQVLQKQINILRSGLEVDGKPTSYVHQVRWPWPPQNLLNQQKK